jgi:hypothetical protein
VLQEGSMLIFDNHLIYLDIIGKSL